MIDLTQQEQILLAKHLNVYIKEKRTQEECSGFIDGFQLALKEVKKLNIVDVSKCYTEKDMDNAYDKGFKDGNQRDLTGSLIEVL